MGKAWNTTDSKSSWKINKNKSQGFLLMLIEAIKPENIAHFPERILRHFLTRVCESSTHDFYVLPLRICKVKCDWFTRADVTEIALVARVRRRYFRRNQWQPEIRLRSQAKAQATRSKRCHWKLFSTAVLNKETINSQQFSRPVA